jgi:hypothetical protein
MADTWRDALLRPLAMAAPNSSVYIELMAPDFRFVLALGLAALVAIGMHKRTNPDRRPIFVLFGLIFLSFVPWIATSGNGRYFMPYLVLIGPLCIGLINMLSCTRGMKAAVVALVLGLQGFALYQNNPWKPYDTWGGTPWRDAPYYSIDIDPQAIEPDTTYITIQSLTMSLLAPQFSTASRWVNLSVFSGSDIVEESIAYAPVRKILRTSKSLKLFQRSAPSEMLVGSDQPNQAAIETYNAYLQPHRLAIKVPTDCKLFASRSPGFSSLQEKSENSEETTPKKVAPGFWLCTLHYPIAIVPKAKLTALEIRAVKVFEKMETLCPLFFPSGQTLVRKNLVEHSRSYPGGDSFLILKHNGDLYVQVALALNPEKIGQADEVLSDKFRIDCTKFRGRTGLPWEREI